MMRWLARPIAFMESCRRRFGDQFSVRFPGFERPMVMLSNPEVIKALYTAHEHGLPPGRTVTLLPVMGPNSVLLLEGREHLARRKLMLPPFHGERMRSYESIMREATERVIERWPEGRPFAIHPHMQAITLEVILRTVIGASDPARLAALRAVMPKLLSVGQRASLAIARPDLQRRRPWRGLWDRIQEADRLLYAEIAERRADPHVAERTDVLAMLVRATDEDGRTLSDRELRDQLMTLLVAGHDTTATGLSWALERLTRHPAVLAKAQHAADAGDAAGDEYLDAVAKETLRIRPVVFEVGRVLKEPVELAGYQLPAGVMVVPGIGLVHSDSDVYPDAERFDPDRMVGATLSPTTWFPFGGGNRRCLGATFAMVEMRVVLREILRRVELATTTAADERQKVKHVIMVPRNGGRIRVRAARQAPVSAIQPAG